MRLVLGLLLSLAFASTEFSGVDHCEDSVISILSGGNAGLGAAMEGVWEFAGGLDPYGVSGIVLAVVDSWLGSEADTCKEEAWLDYIQKHFVTKAEFEEYKRQAWAQERKYDLKSLLSKADSTRKNFVRDLEVAKLDRDNDPESVSEVMVDYMDDMTTYVNQYFSQGELIVSEVISNPWDSGRNHKFKTLFELFMRINDEIIFMNGVAGLLFSFGNDWERPSSGELASIASALLTWDDTLYLWQNELTLYMDLIYAWRRAPYHFSHVTSMDQGMPWHHSVVEKFDALGNCIYHSLNMHGNRCDYTLGYNNGIKCYYHDNTYEALKGVAYKGDGAPTADTYYWENKDVWPTWSNKIALIDYCHCPPVPQGREKTWKDVRTEICSQPAGYPRQHVAAQRSFVAYREMWKVMQQTFMVPVFVPKPATNGPEAPEVDCVEINAGMFFLNTGSKTFTLPNAEYKCPAKVTHDMMPGANRNAAYLNVAQSGTTVTVSNPVAAQGHQFQARFNCCKNLAPLLSTGNACRNQKVQYYATNYAYEVYWDIVDNKGIKVCDSPQNAYDGSEWKPFQGCCLIQGHSYTLNCRDSHGDGWHGGYLKVGKSLLCMDFTDGHHKAVSFVYQKQNLYTNAGSPHILAETEEEVAMEPKKSGKPNPISVEHQFEVIADPEQEAALGCTNVNVETHPVSYAYEMSWRIIVGSTVCNNPSGLTNGRKSDKTCCFPAGTAQIKCEDSYGDGWHGGYLQIDGVKYCNNFYSGNLKQVNDVTFGDKPPSCDRPHGTTTCWEHAYHRKAYGNYIAQGPFGFEEAKNRCIAIQNCVAIVQDANVGCGKYYLVRHSSTNYVAYFSSTANNMIYYFRCRDPLLKYDPANHDTTFNQIKNNGVVFMDDQVFKWGCTMCDKRKNLYPNGSYRLCKDRCHNNKDWTQITSWRQQWTYGELDKLHTFWASQGGRVEPDNFSWAFRKRTPSCSSNVLYHCKMSDRVHYLTRPDRFGRGLSLEDTEMTEDSNEMMEMGEDEEDEVQDYSRAMFGVVEKPSRVDHGVEIPEGVDVEEDPDQEMDMTKFEEDPNVDYTVHTHNGGTLADQEWPNKESIVEKIPGMEGMTKPTVVEEEEKPKLTNTKMIEGTHQGEHGEHHTHGADGHEHHGDHHSHDTDEHEHHHGEHHTHGADGHEHHGEHHSHDTDEHEHHGEHHTHSMDEHEHHGDHQEEDTESEENLVGSAFSPEETTSNLRTMIPIFGAGAVVGGAINYYMQGAPKMTEYTNLLAIEQEI